MELKGKYGTAIVFANDVESSAVSQIIKLLNQPMSRNAHTRIMTDVHAGAGCVIGYTAHLRDQTVPNLIGVDIDCGVIAWLIGKIAPKFDKLDDFIKKNIPSGKKIRDYEISAKSFNDVFPTVTDMPFGSFIDEVKRICKTTGQDYDYARMSLGTLGGGNHFIEIDKDDHGNLWFVIHSGSRNFGYKIAQHHQKIAKRLIRKSYTNEEIKKIVNKYKSTPNRGSLINADIEKLKSSRPKIATDLEYLSGEEAEDYFCDMKIAQIYAKLNRRLMGHKVLEDFYKFRYKDVEMVESVHNYISFTDRIVRKGAISAHKGERLLIPLNMADGIILGTGKGNEEWNFSAPHGAGRKLPRGKAKEKLSLKRFKNIMKKRGVWTSTANKRTLDESPEAYKRPNLIIKYLKDTVDIDSHMKPVYNFKGGE